MHRLFLIGILLLTGCKSTTGPFQPRSPARVDDPLLTIGEQQKRGRDRLALPDETGLAPKTGVATPGVHGR